jgi:predicted RNA-binding Zn-ribbon protein involved in translation (DUF1610 family)
MQCSICSKTVYKLSCNSIYNETDNKYVLCMVCGNEVLYLCGIRRGEHFASWQGTDSVYLTKGDYWNKYVDRVRAMQLCPQCGEKHK